jgi:hypothetical protein
MRSARPRRCAAVRVVGPACRGAPAGRGAPASRGAPAGRRALASLIGLLLVGAAAGCGESVELPDLFVVQRSGAGPKLTVVVNEGGAVRCDGGPTRQLSDAQIVQARGLQEELQSPSAKHLALPPRSGSVFSYFVRDSEGTVRFSDNSAGQTSVLRQLAYFVLEVEQKVCHLPG